MSGFFSRPQKAIFKIGDFDYVEGVDITIGVKIRELIKDVGGISYTPYVISDGQRPDNVAQEAYGDPNLDWTILLANNILNIYDEWPKSSLEFKDYLIQKYGSVSFTQSTIKNYYDGNGYIINATDYSALPANSGKKLESIYEYETRLNFNKTRIRIFKADIAKKMSNARKSVISKPLL